MAVFAVYIEKSTTYRNEENRFGNTYHYQTDFGDQFDDAEVAQFVHDQEQPVTQGIVNFVGWRTWGPTDGTAADNVIRESGVFADAGGAPTEANMYVTNAAVPIVEVQRAPVTNRRRYLWKFIRNPSVDLAAWTANQLRGIDPMPQEVQDALLAYAQAVTNFTTSGGSNITLCNAQGDATAVAADWTVNPYLRTRQIDR